MESELPLRSWATEPQRSHSHSILYFFVSKSGTANVYHVGLLGRTPSVQVEHSEGARRPASTPASFDLSSHLA